MWLEEAQAEVQEEWIQVLPLAWLLPGEEFLLCLLKAGHGLGQLAAPQGPVVHIKGVQADGGLAELEGEAHLVLLPPDAGPQADGVEEEGLPGGSQVGLEGRD